MVRSSMTGSWLLTTSYVIRTGSTEYQNLSWKKKFYMLRIILLWQVIQYTWRLIDKFRRFSLGRVSRLMYWSLYGSVTSVKRIRRNIPIQQDWSNRFPSLCWLTYLSIFSSSIDIHPIASSSYYRSFIIPFAIHLLQLLIKWHIIPFMV